MGCYERRPTGCDTDGDRIPDEWELLHHGNITNMTVSGDEDGDGADNEHEYIADTDPCDQDSFFRIIGISNTPHRVVYFPSSSAREYTLDSAPNVTGVWERIPDQEHVPGAGGADSLRDTNAPAPECVYRVRVRMP